MMETHLYSKMNVHRRNQAKLEFDQTDFTTAASEMPCGFRDGFSAILNYVALGMAFHTK